MLLPLPHPWTPEGRREQAEDTHWLPGIPTPVLVMEMKTKRREGIGARHTTSPSEGWLVYLEKFTQDENHDGDVSGSALGVGRTWGGDLEGVGWGGGHRAAIYPGPGAPGGRS